MESKTPLLWCSHIHMYPPNADVYMCMCILSASHFLSLSLICVVVQFVCHTVRRNLSHHGEYAPPVQGLPDVDFSIARRNISYAVLQGTFPNRALFCAAKKGGKFPSPEAGCLESPLPRASWNHPATQLVLQVLGLQVPEEGLLVEAVLFGTLHMYVSIYVYIYL